MIPWARRLIDKAAGDIPIYGSPEWDALDDTDPRKVAACVRAAEAWRQDGEPDAIRAQVLDDLAQIERYFAYRMRQASKDLRDGHDWAAASRRVSWAELQRRRQLTDESEAA